MNQHNRISFRSVVSVQLVFVGALAAGWFLLPGYQRARIQAEIRGASPLPDVRIVNEQPYSVAPLYDDPDVVSDEELAMVLTAILPRFGQEKLRPNFVEHALRVWGCEIEFGSPDLVSGPQMTDFLLDTGKYVASWGSDSEPILEPEDQGIHVRWGPDQSASVHHDHMLASLAEAGVSLNRAVFTPARRTNLREVFLEALRDFRPDERETEWSVMAFASWLAPQQTFAWHNGDGRDITFDMLARRLLRSHKQRGVCLGTHRVYSLMMLVRMDDEFDLISDETRREIMSHLGEVRDLIIAAQDEDGSWLPNWTDGAEAKQKADPQEEQHRRVIATGHHLEWLAIAPEELHPPRELVLRAADWVINNVRTTPQEEIDGKYTFYSHVGNALALWRHTSAPEFWQEWRRSHSDAESPVGPASDPEF